MHMSSSTVATEKGLGGEERALVITEIIPPPQHLRRRVGSSKSLSKDNDSCTSRELVLRESQTLGRYSTS